LGFHGLAFVLFGFVFLTFGLVRPTSILYLPRLITVNIKSLCMSEGIQKRVQPDLVQEIEAYSGGSFSEKMVKWKNDVDRMTHDDIDDAVSSVLQREMPEILRRET